MSYCTFCSLFFFWFELRAIIIRQCKMRSRTVENLYFFSNFQDTLSWFLSIRSIHKLSIVNWNNYRHINVNEEVVFCTQMLRNVNWEFHSIAYYKFWVRYLDIVLLWSLSIINILKSITFGTEILTW